MHHIEHIWTMVVLKICKHTFYAYLSRIWKLMHFTRFIRKVFATKIMLSGKFSFFLTLEKALSYIWLDAWSLFSLNFAFVAKLLNCVVRARKWNHESDRKLTKQINMAMKKQISLTNCFDFYVQHFSNATSPIPSRPSWLRA